MKLCILVGLYLCAGIRLQAQKEAYNWYFGNNAGITFSTNPPSALINGQLSTNEGCATISDFKGKLLFYTDGISIWDSTHKIMPNGNGLKGDPSSTQSAIIVPWPDSANKYYIFTLAEVVQVAGLQYSEVDMRLNAGKGDVIKNRKNIKIRNNVCEKLTAVLDSSGHGYWVLVAVWQSDSILAYHVTSAGVNIIPVVSRTGFIIQGPSQNTAAGYMKTSPDGKRIAYVNERLAQSVLADFNAATGTVSNVWPFNTKDAYGVEFSAQSKFLYVSELYTRNIFQFDLSATNLADFLLTKIIIDQSHSEGPCAMQLGPDHKIYLSPYGKTFLSVIQQPDLPGLSCNLKKYDTNLSSKKATFGLPNFVPTLLRKKYFKVSRNCSHDSTSFIISDLFNCDSLKWDFGDPGSGISNISLSKVGVYHIYNNPGSYTVMLVTYFRNNIDSAFETFYINAPLKPDLGKDTALCNTFSKTLQVKNKFITYLWTSNNSSSPSIKISKKGVYILKVSDSNNCKSSDTIEISNPKIKANLEISDTSVCLEGHLLKLKDKSVLVEDERLTSNWNFGDKTYGADTIVTKMYNKSGIYKIKLVIESKEHCQDSVHINVSVFPKFKVFIGNDTAFCHQFSHLIKASPGFTSYNWNTGSTAMQITVNTKGIYSVKVLDSNTCPSGDTIAIDEIKKPSIKLSYDSVNCVYTYISIDTVKNIVYQWNTGEKSKNIKVDKKGWYSITASHQFCSRTDSIYIDKLAKPEVDLGIDTSLCANEIILRTKEKGSFIWSTGETRPSIVINQPGKYWLTVSRNNCSATDTIDVKLCEDLLVFIPIAFTPNDDNTNEVFKVYGSNITDVEIQIFNRWGEKILVTSGKDSYWDGTYKNEMCMEGVYCYLVKVRGKKAGSEKYLRGTVTLLR